MSIQFKFRSSVNFDSVDIDGKLSISVRDLRSKIVRQKNLNVCQDFDLVFSDALTGEEYNDEKFQIPSGSSVIIKRVPARTLSSVPEPIVSDAINGKKDLDLFAPVSGQPDDFDDFGIDLCPVPDGTFPVAYPEFDQKNCTGSGNEYIAGSSSRWKHEASDLSEAGPRGIDSGAEGRILQKNLESEFHEPKKLEKVASTNHLDLQNFGLPSELKCSLCNMFFKEAVMIPCCQHSFCEKCIREVLIVKASCPKCSSRKCRVEDLLPNLSLRQAIEHFLESLNLTTSMDNALQKYAPDGESGIVAMDFSCAVAVTKKKPNMPCSPSATEKGSNQIMAESFYETLNRKKASLEGSSYPLPSSLRGRQFNGKVDGPEDSAAAADFQGENQPINWPKNHVADEGDSTINKRRGLWADPAGGDRSFIAAGRSKKVDRTCYMCGSPNHFIRDCPVASTPHPMFQTGISEAMFQAGMPGYASSCWNGAAFPPIHPYMNMYGNPAMMPFNANMVPITPYAVPQYAPSMYGGFPIPRMGGLAPPVGTRAERPLNHSEFLEIRGCENRRKLSNDWRGQPLHYEDDDSHKRHQNDEIERVDEYKSHTMRSRDKSLTRSEDSGDRSLRMKHRHDKRSDQHIQSVDKRYEKDPRSTVAGRNRRSYHSERSNSGVEDVHHSTDRNSDARHKQHHSSYKKHHESRGQSGSDSSMSRHYSKKERVVKKKSDVRDSKHKYDNHSSSGLEPHSSTYQKKRCKDTDHRCSLRDSRERSKPTKDECSDRWQMASSSDDDFRDGYDHHKRKRFL